MAFDLVTARHGKSHIMADMIARQNSAMFGKGRYILNVGNNLKPTMTSANKLSIASGAMIADGRYIENTDTYTFDIANGTQSQYRKDLAVLTVSIGSDYIGTITPSVLKGTPASTLAAAEDPTYTAGNLLNGDTTAVIPLARVTLNGLTPSVALIPGNVKSLNDIGDSVSQATTKTSGSLGNGGTYEARNGVVSVTVENVTQAGSKERVIGTLPAGLRPSKKVYGVTNYSQYAGLIWILTSGQVVVWAPYGGDYTGQVVFCV